MVFSEYRVQVVKILGQSQENREAQFPQFSVFVSQKSIFRRYRMQNIKDGIQILVYKINNESVTHFTVFLIKKRVL